MSNEIATTGKKAGLVQRFGDRYGVDPAKVMHTLKATAFKQRDGTAPSNEQMMSLMIVADQHGLNPFTKEIYAFQDKGGGIVPVVGVDGWSRIINDHPKSDGLEFVASADMVQADENAKPCPEWIECIIHRKDRKQPIRVREYLDEVYRPQSRYPGPWQTHTKRMLRHKAMIQAARIAFGFSGIYDEDEAHRIVDGEFSVVDTATSDDPNDLFGLGQGAADTGQPQRESADTAPPYTVDDLISQLNSAKDGDAIDQALADAGALNLTGAEQERFESALEAANERVGIAEAQ